MPYVCASRETPSGHGDSNTVPSMETLVVLKQKHASRHVFLVCAPTGIRTPVVALKGLRPSPLDDGGIF